MSWIQQHMRLVGKLLGLIPSTGSLLLEIGCGKGQLTIPLAKQAKNHQIIAVDSYRRPYTRKDYRELVSTLERERLKRRVSVVVSDYSHWLSRQADEKFGGVISSEFLPEINSTDLVKFLAECQRIIKPGGMALHSFLSPVARNRGQALLIEADSDPQWAKDPPKEWFSPPPNFVVSELRRAGFHRMRVIRSESRLIFRAEAARILLKDWGVRDSFWRKHRPYLQQKGLEVPDWILTAGVKPDRSTASSGAAMLRAVSNSSASL